MTLIESRIRTSTLFLFFSLFPISSTLYARTPFFITIDSVELKDASGKWVTVIRPDRRLDLAQEEPVVRFFNNGRIPPGDYSNVRVTFTLDDAEVALKMERIDDYAPPLSVKKGAFVGVSFAFDWQAADRLSSETVKEVRLVVDQEERVDTGKDIKLWS